MGGFAKLVLLLVVWCQECSRDGATALEEPRATFPGLRRRLGQVSGPRGSQEHVYPTDGGQHGQACTGSGQCCEKGRLQSEQDPGGPARQGAVLDVLRPADAASFRCGAQEAPSDGGEAGTRPGGGQGAAAFDEGSFNPGSHGHSQSPAQAGAGCRRRMAAADDQRAQPGYGRDGGGCGRAWATDRRAATATCGSRWVPNFWYAPCSPHGRNWSNSQPAGGLQPLSPGPRRCPRCSQCEDGQCGETRGHQDSYQPWACQRSPLSRALEDIQLSLSSSTSRSLPGDEPRGWFPGVSGHVVADVSTYGGLPRRGAQGLADTPGDRCPGDCQEGLSPDRPNSSRQACQSAQPCDGPIPSWRLGAPAPARRRWHRQSGWQCRASGQPGRRGHRRRRASPSGISGPWPPGVMVQHLLHSPSPTMARLWRELGAMGPACRELSGPGFPCTLRADPVQGRGRCDAMLISEVALDLYSIGGSEACPLVNSTALVLANTFRGPGYSPPTLPHPGAGWLWVLSNSDSTLRGIFASCLWTFGAGMFEMLLRPLGICPGGSMPAVLHALDFSCWPTSRLALFFLETPALTKGSLGLGPGQPSARCLRLAVEVPATGEPQSLQRVQYAPKSRIGGAGPTACCILPYAFWGCPTCPPPCAACVLLLPRASETLCVILRQAATCYQPALSPFGCLCGLGPGRPLTPTLPAAVLWAMRTVLYAPKSRIGGAGPAAYHTCSFALGIRPTCIPLHAAAAAHLAPRLPVTPGLLARPAPFCKQPTSSRPYGSWGLGLGRSLAPYLQPSGDEPAGCLRGVLPFAGFGPQGRIASADLITDGWRAVTSVRYTVPSVSFTSEVPCRLSRHAAPRYHPASPCLFGSCGIGPSKTLASDGWRPDHVLDRPSDWALHPVRPAPKSRIGGAGPTAGLLPSVPFECCLPGTLSQVWLAGGGASCTSLSMLLRDASSAPKSRIGGSGPTACAASSSLSQIKSHDFWAQVLRGSAFYLSLWIEQQAASIGVYARAYVLVSIGALLLSGLCPRRRWLRGLLNRGRAGCPVRRPSGHFLLPLGHCAVSKRPPLPWPQVGYQPFSQSRRITPARSSRASLCLWSFLLLNLPVSITAMPTPGIPHTTAGEASELTEGAAHAFAHLLPAQWPDMLPVPPPAAAQILGLQVLAPNYQPLYMQIPVGPDHEEGDILVHAAMEASEGYHFSFNQITPALPQPIDGYATVVASTLGMALMDQAVVILDLLRASGNRFAVALPTPLAYGELLGYIRPLCDPIDLSLFVGQSQTPHPVGQDLVLAMG